MLLQAELVAERWAMMLQSGYRQEGNRVDFAAIQARASGRQGSLDSLWKLGRQQECRLSLLLMARVVQVRKRINQSSMQPVQGRCSTCSGGRYQTLEPIVCGHWLLDGHCAPVKSCQYARAQPCHFMRRVAFCVPVQASPDQLNNFQHCQSMLRLWLSGMLEPGMRATVLELTKVRP